MPSTGSGSRFGWPFGKDKDLPDSPRWSEFVAVAFTHPLQDVLQLFMILFQHLSSIQEDDEFLQR